MLPITITSLIGLTAALLPQQDHWAFKPPRDVAPPAVKDAAWAYNEIDRFILARLEKEGLKPQAPADRRTLIRRVTFDLTGLPPTPEEIAAFLADNAAGAYTRLVDRLLASPHYGERWGRHWLDVARYADTKGYLAGNEERRYPFAYTYRDWVIDALNRDLPYDQFLVQQIAADRLDLGGDPRPLAAMGFLTVGRRFLNVEADIIDDRLDTLMRGTQALTVSCARCHDHKFDPIPTADYYSLYGIFASSQEPGNLPALAKPGDSAEFAAFQKELAKRQAALDEYRAKKIAERLGELKTPKAVAAYLVAGQRVLKMKNLEEMRSYAQERDLNLTVVRRWRDYLENNSSPIFASWRAFADGKTAPAGDPRVVAAFSKPPASLEDAAERYAALLTGELRAVLDGPDSPTTFSEAALGRILSRDERNKLRDLEKEVESLKATHDGAPPHAMVLRDASNPSDARIFVRGNPANPGKTVPRRFLSVLAGPDAAPFTDGSGRLQLARAIASAENPLTARVMVNRVWMHHFGAPLVETPSDFGRRSEPPSHPELLDWLARRFVADGWSLKKLHRLMLTSSAYRQKSTGPVSDKDPRNRLLSRMNRGRLEFEALRDSMLDVAGRLDRTMGGRAVPLSMNPTVKVKKESETLRFEGDGDPTKEEFTRRRSVYLFIDRQNLPGTLRTFDFAGPDTHCPSRHETIVPQQALFLMNSPFIAEQSRHLAARLEGDDAARVRRLYELTLSRPPDDAELVLALRFVKSEPWERFAQVILMSNEYVFVD